MQWALVWADVAALVNAVLYSQSYVKQQWHYRFIGCRTPWLAVFGRALAGFTVASGYFRTYIMIQESSH